MLTSDKKLANFMGGKTARACDNCIRRCARWYCAADDAFLCQSCDGLVHAANPLARRHERLRLKVASLKLSCLDKPPPPPWHQGFTKKPRTPRGGNHHKQASRQETNSEERMMSFNPVHLVPEIGSDETSEEQLLYQVPVLDPLFLSWNSNEVVKQPAPVSGDQTFDLNGMIDVERLLGKGVDGVGLGMLDCGEKDSGHSLEGVKVEEDEMQYEMVEMMSEPFQLSFDYLWEEKDEKVAVAGAAAAAAASEVEDGENKKKKRILKLDFERIIAAWDEQRSPWTTGYRPEVDPDDCWPECMGGCGIMHHHHHHHYGDMGMNPAMLDGGREARVSRYREKRRTRLFSKKIRYEVRKLNAEKRPRMKGRFVKRVSSSFA